MVRLKYVVPFLSVILLAANQLIGFPLNWPMRAPENRTVHKMTDENGTRYLKRLRFLSFHTINILCSNNFIWNQFFSRARKEFLSWKSFVRQDKDLRMLKAFDATKTWKFSTFLYFYFRFYCNMEAFGVSICIEYQTLTPYPCNYIASLSNDLPKQCM